MISRKFKNVLSKYVTHMRFIIAALLFILFFTLSGALISTNSAFALDIQYNYIGSFSQTQKDACESAADIWENIFYDPVIVTINIGFLPSSAFDEGVIGYAINAKANISYGQVLTAMMGDATNPLEKSAIALLPAGSLPVTDTNGNRTDGTLTLSTANARALNFSYTGAGQIHYNADGVIMFNEEYIDLYDFTRDDGIGDWKIDFTGVIAHEIGHVLGFFSVTDSADSSDSIKHPSTLDLWRFSGYEDPHAHDITNDYRLITAGKAEYYDSIFNNIPLSSGKLFYDPNYCDAEDGRCLASHWRDDQQNLMHPRPPGYGTIFNPKEDDIHALNYIGYDDGISLTKTPTYCLIDWKILTGEEIQPSSSDDPDPTPWYSGSIKITLDPENEALYNRIGICYARYDRDWTPKDIVIEVEEQETGNGTWQNITNVAPYQGRCLKDFSCETNDGNPKISLTALQSENGIQLQVIGQYVCFKISGFGKVGSQEGDEGGPDFTFTTTQCVEGELTEGWTPDGITTQTIDGIGSNRITILNPEVFSRED